MDIHAIDVLVPAPDDGKPGNDAVNYVIVCSNSSPNVTDGDVTVSLTAYKIEGSKKETVDMTKFVFYIDGDRGANTSNPLRVTIKKGNTTPKLVYLRDLSLANTYAECAINPVVNGENSIRVDLDNEMDSVPCDNSGAVLSDTTITTRATIYEGSKPVNTGVSGPGTGSLSLAGTNNGTGIDNGVVTVSWYIQKGTVLISNRYTVTIPITYNNVTYNAMFTLNAVRSGKNGISPTIFQVKPSLTSINFKRVSDKNNTLTPSSVTITCGYTKNVDGKVTVVNYCDGRVENNHYIYYRFDNGSWTALTSQAGVSVPNTTNNTFIEFCISTEGATSNVSDSNIIDRETVPIVKGGSNGSDGKTVTAQYSINGTDSWHPKFVTGDIWMRTSDDGGKTWGTAMRVVGERGSDGSWTEYSFNISSALTSANVNTAPTPLGLNSWQDAPVQTNSSYPYLWMRVQNYSNKTTKDGNASYVRVTGEKGPQGITGGVGPMMYYAGEWQAGVSYVRTSRVVPLLSHGDDEFFYYPAKEGTLTDNEPSSTNKSWEQQQMVPLLLAKMMMVAFGKIGSAVFYGDYMFSQYGKEKSGSGYREINGSNTAAEIGAAYSRFEVEQPDDGDFVPNLYLNFLTGMMRSYKMKAYDMEAHGGTFEDVTVSGLLKGVSGTFKRLSYSEDDNVYIGFSDDGRIWFYGDMQHQGADPTEHRSYRFLSSDIWCRGAFGHREKLIGWVKDTYMYVYPKGTDENGTKIELDSSVVNGVTFYKIPLYSPKYQDHSEVAGMPIDVIVFNCSKDYYYNFTGKGNGKEWAVINGNDAQQIHFADIGGWHSLAGGTSLRCTYVPQKMLNPQSCKIGGGIGEGIFWTGSNDLNWIPK